MDEQHQRDNQKAVHTHASVLLELRLCPATAGCSSQLCPCFGRSGRILGHQLADFANKVGLLGTAFAGLAPLLQDLLQVLHLQLLQVHRGQVQLFVCRKKDNYSGGGAVLWQNAGRTTLLTGRIILDSFICSALVHN